MSEYIEIPFIKVTQPIGSFYIGSVRYEDLLAIAYADIRKIDQEGRDDDNFDTYLGIQRQVSKSRIQEIESYVQTIDATFPTSVILHIKSKEDVLDGRPVHLFDDETIDNNLERISTRNNILVDQEKKLLLVLKDENVAQILDGQHRLEGLRQFKEDNGPDAPQLLFELNVTIFVDLDLDDQAQIFSVINKAQTKVNKSLVYDLYEYARFRSPQKTAHDVVRILNRRKDSPFYRKIKVLGSAEDTERETIAQATFAEAIIRHISQDPMKDRDDLRRGSFLQKAHIQDLPDQKFVLRRLFSLEKDEYIVKNLMNYFSAVANRWPSSWSEKTEGNILNKSTGLLALMRLFKDISNRIGRYGDVISEGTYAEFFENIPIQDGLFLKTEYIPGTSGQSKLYHSLLDGISVSL